MKKIYSVKEDVVWELILLFELCLLNIVYCFCINCQKQYFVKIKCWCKVVKKCGCYNGCEGNSIKKYRCNDVN